MMKMKPEKTWSPASIRMIALDLDGTTLTRDGLTRRTKETLEEAIRRGIHVVIATGRTYTALPERVHQIQGLEYIITSNGAHISEAQTGKFIYSNYASAEAVDRVLDIGEYFLPGRGFYGGKSLYRSGCIYRPGSGRKNNGIYESKICTAD